MATAPKHATARQVSEEFGLSPRYWTRMAAEGRIPGAWQPSGEGGAWLFDRDALRMHWLSQIPEGPARSAEARRLNQLSAAKAGAAASKAKAVLRKECATDHIYIARSGDLVKIGVSNNVKRRLHSFKTASAHPVELLHSFPGSNAAEAQLHARFRHLRSHGEWFRLEPDLIEYLRAEGVDVL